VFGIGVVLRQGLRQGGRIDAGDPGQFGKAVGAQQVAGVNQCAVVDRPWTGQSHAVVVHGVAVADQPAGRIGAAVGEHAFDETVVGVGLIDETAPGAVDRDHARLGAVGDQVRKAFDAAIGLVQHRDRRPEKVRREVVADGRVDRRGQAMSVTDVGRR
jgi:hypothetical protein